jgi:succinyl-CoA synthetase beta subunit
MIAEAIVAAADHFKNVPVVVRLQGTNAKEGQEMVCSRSLLPAGAAIS